MAPTTEHDQSARPSTLLITGGAGYIGSHTCVALQAAGYRLVVLDNFCNSQPETLDRVERISGQRLTAVHGDVRDRALLDRVLSEQAIAGVIHFAGLKAVGESSEKPLDYYENNVAGSVTLLQAMQAAGVKTLVFSSSATVYGMPQFLPYTEAHPLAPVNPYGRTKLMVEDMLRDLQQADAAWRIAILRYFNPVGAHPSGLIGEDPQGIPNNLMPFIAQVAGGRRAFLNIWGNDYDTPDGTGVRDYIHVDDLAAGHVAALQHLQRGAGSVTLNLGSGVGHSVLEVAQAFEAACGRPIARQFAPRRAGDLPAFWADSSLAQQVLGWRAASSLTQMCEDTWRFQRGLQTAS
ncbi:MAG: UDP-glucose 4-epimerase GalE [Burkholderiaceae bacterium]|nr:UDP-glucose 4-epimerase GalE [Burkholderiaceae bacterium]